MHNSYHWHALLFGGKFILGMEGGGVDLELKVHDWNLVCRVCVSMKLGDVLVCWMGDHLGPVDIGGFKGLPLLGWGVGQDHFLSIFRALNPGGPGNCVRIMSLILENGWVGCVGVGPRDGASVVLGDWNGRGRMFPLGKWVWIGEMEVCSRAFRA